jgi:hypothetical protein
VLAALLAGFLLGLLSDLKIEAVWSSKTSVDFYQTTQGYIPEIVLFIDTEVRTFDPR